ncbi:hypothetical protein JKP88DRAFT_326478 [Tribonema minus]|uniref:Uncharacterized protein n=1 Tax=Tribonema minus TaxID=303371 RepID=A0A835YYI5_9STRA|nr:hypothetical protein JKP88DRAFT_326478 [Tribonema minus]
MPIPLLCTPPTFLSGLRRLREAKPAAVGMSATGIHSSYAKGANAAAKALLGDPQCVFGDLRVAFAALTHKLYCHGRGGGRTATAKAKAEEKRKASGKGAAQIAISNGRKKARREAELREEQQSVLGSILDPEITDEEAKQIVIDQVYTNPMVAEFIAASTTDQKIPGYFGLTGGTIKKEAVRFLWANNSRPVVQPIDGASDPRAGQKGFLTEANARELVEYTPEPLYSSNNVFNVNKVEFWAQKLQDHLPLGVKLWRVCNAGGGEDQRAGVGKLYKIFFTKLRDTPENLQLRVVE